MVRAFTCEPFGRVKIILPEILTLFIRANTLNIKDINKAKIIKIKILFFILPPFKYSVYSNKKIISLFVNFVFFANVNCISLTFPSLSRPVISATL